MMKEINELLRMVKERISQGELFSLRVFLGELCAESGVLRADGTFVPDYWEDSEFVEGDDAFRILWIPGEEDSRDGWTPIPMDLIPWSQV